MTVQQTVSREQIRSIIDDEMNQWDALVNDVGLSRLNQPGLMGEWTFLDVASHLTVWRSETLAQLDAAGRGLPVPPREHHDDTEAETIAANQDIYEREHSRSAVDILHDAHDSYVQLQRTIERLTDDQLTDPNLFAWLDGKQVSEYLLDRSFFEHFHEHAVEVRSQLASVD